MGKTYKTDAIVLYSRRYGETDSIITLLSPSEGKIQAIAKGARKTKSRMRGPTQPLVYGTFMLHRGKSLHTVTQCDYIESFKSLREDLNKFAMASYIAELTEAFLLEGEVYREVSMHLLKALHALSADANLIFVRHFELQLLSQLGYMPELDCCVSCGKIIKQKAIGFAIKAGGVTCFNCNMEGDDAISPAAIAVMRQLLVMDILKTMRIKINKNVEEEVRQINKKMIAYRLEKPLKSEVFLNSLTV